MTERMSFHHNEGDTEEEELGFDASFGSKLKCIYLRTADLDPDVGVLESS